jgi:hypothetical protein
MAPPQAPTCPACTLINEVGALQCSMCSTVLQPVDDGRISCSRCTYDNAADAETCVMCGLAFAEEVPWSCSICCEGDGDFEYLECAHRACRGCHQRWIASCDDTGKEPTCLTCDKEEAESKPLSPAAIKLLLGDEANQQREQRLLAKVANLVDCPTPDCTNRFQLPEGMQKRSTCCQLCMQHVVLSRPTLLSLLAPSALGAAGASSSSAVDPAANGTSAAAPIELGSSSSDDDEDVPLQQRAAAKEAEQRSLLEQLGLQQCPDCGHGIEKKKDTCHKFQCTCGCRFCWKCGKRANERGLYTCRCTGADHVAWDNARNRAAPRTTRTPGKGTKRPREAT